MSYVRRLPSSLSDASSGVYPDDIASGDQIKHTVTLNKIEDSSAFELCWKHLEGCKYIN